MTIYTSGDWHVIPGREAEFVSAWNEFAQWSAANIDPNAHAQLLRDREDSSHFISIGSWRDDDTVDRWRASDGFRKRMPELKSLTESSRVMTLEVVAQTQQLQPMP